MAKQPTQGLRAFLLYSSLPIGGLAVCFLGGTYALLEQPVHLPLLMLGFCATFLVYQIERTAGTAPEDQVNQPERIVWLSRHRRYVRFSSLLAAGIGLFMLPLLRPATLAIGFGLSSLCMLYMVPVGLLGRRLKDHWLLKPVVISMAWSVGGVLLPVVQAGEAVSPAVFAFIAYRFLFVLPNTLLSDWPDRAGDTQAGLTTIATRLPLRHIRWLATASLLIGLGGVLAAYVLWAASWLWLVDAGGLGLMLAMVWRPVPPSRFAFSFALDMAVAWPVVTACIAWVQ